MLSDMFLLMQLISDRAKIWTQKVFIIDAGLLMNNMAILLLLVVTITFLYQASIDLSSIWLDPEFLTNVFYFSSQK